MISNNAAVMNMPIACSVSSFCDSVKSCAHMCPNSDMESLSMHLMYCKYDIYKVLQMFRMIYLCSSILKRRQDCLRYKKHGKHGLEIDAIIFSSVE